MLRGSRGRTGASNLDGCDAADLVDFVTVSSDFYSELEAYYSEEAQEWLAELEKARALMSPETSRPYGIEVSGIIRRYIERRFGLVAPRRSTEEFLVEASASAKLEPAHRQLLAEFLGTCDFLKFARARAELAELEAQHKAAVRFVTETPLVAVKPEVRA